MSRIAVGGPTQVEFADIDGIECCVPGIIAPGQYLSVGDFVVFQFVLGNVGLAVDDIFDQVVILLL